MKRVMQTAHFLCFVHPGADEANAEGPLRRSDRSMDPAHDESFDLAVADRGHIGKRSLTIRSGEAESEGFAELVVDAGRFRRFWPLHGHFRLFDVRPVPPVSLQFPKKLARFWHACGANEWCKEAVR